jgi:hypothetical protein
MTKGSEAVPEKLLNQIVIRTRGVRAFASTRCDEKRLWFSNHFPWKRPTSLCHLDRSAA